MRRQRKFKIGRAWSGFGYKRSPTPEHNPRTKIEVVVRDDQVDSLIYKIADKLRASLSSTAEREGRELFERLNCN